VGGTIYSNQTLDPLKELGLYSQGDKKLKFIYIRSAMLPSGFFFLIKVGSGFSLPALFFPFPFFLSFFRVIQAFNYVGKQNNILS
jgi:hypothetical protein